MSGRGGKAWAVLAALLLVVAGGVLVALRPWAAEGRAATEDDGRPAAGSVSGSGSGSGPESGSESRSGSAPGNTPAGSVTVLAAGDIGRCDEKEDEASARIVEQFPDATVLALGDLAYENGSAADFAKCYDPSWGSFKERTRAVPGNHEYRTPGAAPYFDYFGSSVGEPGKGWYSFDLAGWHVVALNSNCEDVGCESDSEQANWLEADLEASGVRCTLAFWHHPRFSSGSKHGGTEKVQDLWQVLLDRDVELVLSSHEHMYERTAPLDAGGREDVENGMRQFVVGTAGGNFYELGKRIRGSEAAIVDTTGLLGMTLRPDGYDWTFMPARAAGDTDTGSAQCR